MAESRQGPTSPGCQARALPNMPLNGLGESLQWGVGGAASANTGEGNPRALGVTELSRGQRVGGEL